MEYRRDIQGLRALAVLFVLLFHIKPSWLPGGFIGVDVFFVISGFLVSSIILKKLNANTFSFRDFYISRLKRIVPAYYFLLLCVAVAGAVILLGSDVTTFKRVVAHAMLFNTDYVYAKLNSYFGMSLQQDPLLHTWTIAIEMKFYLLLPLLLYWVNKKFLIYAIAGISIALLLYGTYEIEINHNTTWAYYSLLLRIPEFCVGVLLALAPKRQVLHKVKPFAGIAGIAILFLCAFLFGHTTHFPGFAAMLPCLGAALLIWPDSGPVHVFLSSRVLVFTGALSYSVYLWHWPIIALMRYCNAGSTFTITEVVLIITLTLACAWASYTFVENFFRKRKTIVFWCSMVPLFGILGGLYLFLPKINEHLLQIPTEYIRPVFGVKSHNVPNVETFGDTTAQPKILLMGNSHALAMKAYLNYLGRKNHFSFRTITCDSYPAIEGLLEKDALVSNRIFDYNQSRRLVPVTKKEIEKANVIIMVLNSWNSIPSLRPAIENMARSLDEGQQLLLISAFPGLDKHPVQVNRAITKDKTKQQFYKIDYENQIADIAYLEAKYRNVHIMSLEKSDAYKTVPFYNDTIMYYDSNHINRFGAEVLAKHTEKQFMDLLNALPK